MTRQITWQENGGTCTVTLPDALGKLVYYVKPSPIPGTPAWEWVVCNIPCDVMPGMTAGFANDEAAAIRSLRTALDFWRGHGYDTAEPPDAPGALSPHDHEVAAVECDAIADHFERLADLHDGALAAYLAQQHRVDAFAIRARADRHRRKASEA